ncbi:hypothetical protein [Methylobacterium sp. R2-1]|uniref:hypothetical protein n=1 Tax=Methylobacterium sp. R2-1 TaxID=2587064 RepID=UPI00161E1210|nr:hypothetical protein [Methylobacterium sp. R2-1]MBB2959845.1 hypothetical protein [Methylobacterium sp. R2-1]
MARTLEEKIRSPKLARAFGPGYRPPTTGMDSLAEGEPLVVFPDKVLLVGSGGGAYETFDLSGASGGPVEDLTAPAVEPISGHRGIRAVAGGVALASASDPSHFGALVGISTGAAAAGALCTYVAAGPVTEPSWSWSPGPVLLGPDGLLTQQEPTSGFLQQVGLSDAPTRLIVGILPPIKIAG